MSTGQRDALLPGRVANKPAILAFLNSLAAKAYDQTVPATVPSGLAVGGNPLSGAAPAAGQLAPNQY